VYYSLFTEGYEIFGKLWCIVPLVFLLPILVLGSAWSLGVDIRRSEAQPQASWLPRLGLHLLVAVLLSMIYIGIAGCEVG
jgi:hypothetical protein